MMNDLKTRICWTHDSEKNSEAMLTREWLVTNGLGGYASGTISGVVTRRYHGLLIAALPNPLGRTVMLNHLSETFQLPDGKIIDIGGEEKGFNDLSMHGIKYLSEFRLDLSLPIWRYEFEGYVLEKSIFMAHNHNTVFVSYEIISGNEPVILTLRPSVHFRKHENAVNVSIPQAYNLIINGRQYEISGDTDLPHLKLYICREHVSLDISSNMTREIYYRLEAERGYEFIGKLWSPGSFKIKIEKGKNAVLIASIEDWDTIIASNPDQILDAEKDRCQTLLNKAGDIKNNSMASELILAADQFIITPVGRAKHTDPDSSDDDQFRTVIAGYHWFTDWGRDTMISLEGLTLTTGRFNHAKWILRTFAEYIKDGLIPNLFPEGQAKGLYHTADATLWFFHAVNRYVTLTNDYETLELILPKFKDIVDHHIKGTLFNIHVDHSDGLLSQGQEHYQLTWMDAKVGDWVVTPRRGKAVEINALWYNALCLFNNWLKQSTDKISSEYQEWTQKCYESFNKRFWYDEGGYLYDVVDGDGEQRDDTSCRPNQIFAISLLNPVLEKSKWEPVVNVVKDKLLTPFGLRSLAPGNPNFKAKYFGDLRARDAAYHQGTVWAWLIGPFIDAWLKLYPDDYENPQKFLEGFDSHLCEACVGSISEIFDAEAPYTPRGCIAQAWSVAEVLRCIKKLNH